MDPHAHYFRPRRHLEIRRLRLRRLLRAAVALCIAVLARAVVVWAQTITAPPAQAITHDETDSPQVFGEVVWTLSSPSSPTGATASWSCGPFEHQTRSSLRADSRMDIRVISSEPIFNWFPVTASDQTNWQAGDNDATVTASSGGPGTAQVGLTVTMSQSDFSLLGAGDYQMTVVGTITGN